tara:strand:- start:1257 stop:1520 length:264 start_codon:yes stop_codon:yes gene_type:complete
MTRFHEQIKIAMGEDYFHPNYEKYIGCENDWLLQDYKDFCECMEAGFIIQELGDCFVINHQHIENWSAYGAEHFYIEKFITKKIEEK